MENLAAYPMAGGSADSWPAQLVLYIILVILTADHFMRTASSAGFIFANLLFFFNGLKTNYLQNTHHTTIVPITCVNLLEFINCCSVVF